MQIKPLPWSTTEFNKMPYKKFGNTLLKVSAIGLGTWKFGYPEKGDESRVGLVQSQKIFDRAFQLGITHWDTANRYNMGTGNSERVIGTWIKNNPSLRRSLVLATKLYGCTDGETPNHWGLSRKNVLDSVYASLGRLQTDYLDILYFHEVSDIDRVEESLAAVEDLIRKDLVRYFAVSNVDLPSLKQIFKLSKQAGVRLNIAAVQNHYDILNGELSDKKGVLAYCQKQGISFVSWSPLSRGLLTSKYLELNKNKKGNRLVDEGTLKKDLTPEIISKLQQLNEIAMGLKISLSELVLSYMLTLKSFDTVIPSVTTEAQLESNAKAATLSLDSRLISRIEKVISPAVKP